MSSQHDGGELNAYAVAHVACSRCNAKPGGACVTGGGNFADQVHANRFYAARKMQRLDVIKARANR